MICKILYKVWHSRKKTFLFATLTNTHTNTRTLHINILLGNHLIRITFDHLALLNFTLVIALVG